ncbi:MAG: ABC transporter ATP-binding protein [Rhodospirillales bacterium]
MSFHITARHLAKSYRTGARWRRGSHILSANEGKPDIGVALKDLSFSIKAGERVGIIGPNGAGKSTLLHILAGISEPSSGELSIQGQVHGIMSLGVGLRDELSGRDNIYINGQVHGLTQPEVEARIDDIISFADIGDYIDRPMRTYSSGMKARLSFAMLVFVEPEILLIDEVLSVGDPAFKEKASGRIRELCDRGKIVIFVSHEMNTIVEFCDRCLLMLNGEIVLDDAPNIVVPAYLERIRHENGTALAAKFGVESGTSLNLPDCNIENLSVSGGEISKNVLKTSHPASVYFSLRLNGKVEVDDLVLLVERIDGLLISENRFNGDLGQPKIPRTGAEFEIDLSPLPLSANIYLFSVEVHLSDGRLARRSLVCEVDDDQPPIGGNPALSPDMEIVRESVGPIKSDGMTV